MGRNSVVSDHSKSTGIPQVDELSMGPSDLGCHIRHEFSASETPQHNGMVERKNRTLQEMVHVMLKAKNVLVQLWAEILNTACYTQNIVYLRPRTTMTPYKIWRGKKPNLKNLHEFGSTCFELNDKEHMSKFDLKSDEAMFLGYSHNNKAYRVFNKQ